MKYNGYKRLLWGEVMRVVGGIRVSELLSYEEQEGEVWFEGKGIVLEPMVIKTVIGLGSWVGEEEVNMS